MRTIDTQRGRGQTSQDFVIGIGVFLVAVTFVVGYFPQLVGVYDTGTDARESSLADRAASTILSDISISDSQNAVNETQAAVYFNTALAPSAVRSTLELPRTKFINVTIAPVGGSGSTDFIRNVTTPSGPKDLAGGHEYDGQSSVTLTRIVTVPGNPGLCNPACRLVVRVW